jgi:hypothetical protein
MFQLGRYFRFLNNTKRNPGQNFGLYYHAGYSPLLRLCRLRDVRILRAFARRT